MLATYRDAEDLINIGAYVSGSNEQIDLAIDLIDNFNEFLQQGLSEKPSWTETVTALQKAFRKRE